MRHTIVWVDIPVHNLKRAIAFYSAVLACEVSEAGGPGFTMGIFPHTDNEVGGCLYGPETDNAPSITGPLIYLNAEGRITQAVQEVATHGGRILQEIHPIGPHGFRAIVADSEGNRVALHASSL
jgi:predicted enzyme related to lactoylglutathione lyase